MLPEETKTKNRWQRFNTWGPLALPFIGVILGWYCADVYFDARSNALREQVSFVTQHKCGISATYRDVPIAMPVYSVDTAGNPVIISWDSDSIREYLWRCKDGYTFWQ